MLSGDSAFVFIEYTTSAESRSDPSWNFASRIVKVYVRPSSLIVHSSASIGAIVPSGSTSTTVSWTL